jgi:hypothetical protein
MQPPADARRCDLGDLALALLWAVVLAAAWSAQPPDRGPWGGYILAS